MRDDVTLEDWNDFQVYMHTCKPTMSLEYLQSHKLTESEREDRRKWISDYCHAARHVASLLGEDQIEDDILLLLAYQEL